MNSILYVRTDCGLNALTAGNRWRHLRQATMTTTAQHSTAATVQSLLDTAFLEILDRMQAAEASEVPVEIDFCGARYTFTVALDEIVAPAAA
jgi:hypothetical protein